VIVLTQRPDRYLRAPHLVRSADGGVRLDVVAWVPGRGESILRCELDAEGRVLRERQDTLYEDGIESVARLADGLVRAEGIDEEDVARDGVFRAYVQRTYSESSLYVDGPFGERVEVWRGPGIGAAPAIAADGHGGAWIALHHDVREDSGERDIAKWIDVFHVDAKGVVRVPDAPMSGRDRDMEGEEQGFEFPSIVLLEGGGLRLYGRGSHAFFRQDLSASGWSERTRIDAGDWGCRGRRVTALRNGETVWTAWRERTGIALHLEDAPHLEAARLVPRGALPSAGKRPAARERIAAQDGRFTLFGDIHQHSAHSDGCGAASEPFVRARDAYGDDFCALSDHESFLGKRIGPGEWSYLQSVVDAHDEPGEFAALYAFEWTGRAHPGPGHKVVYAEKRTREVLSRDVLSEGRDLVARCRDEGRIAVPHHVGWTGANEDAHDEHIQPVWEICSCHGCYETFAHELGQRGDLRDQMVDAVLRRGHRFGFIASSDSHGLLWHHGVARKRDPFRTGLTAVQATACTREAILAAIRDRRCYATSGAKIVLDFRADGAPMGSLLVGRKAREFAVRVTGTAPIASLELVGPEGVLARSEPHDTTSELSAVLDESYVYARIKQSDGEMAWSSPIFTEHHSA
jgi:hypothetical protein